MTHPPVTIGPLTLERFIGGDDFIESYKARLESTGSRDVFALKINPRALTDPNHRRALETRIQDLMGVRHPFLVPVIEFMDDSGSFYLVEEWIEGTSLDFVLSRCLEQGVGLPHNVYLNLATQICNGLEALHGRTGRRSGATNLLHMALGPPAIFLTSDGKVVIGKYGLTPSPMSTRHAGPDGLPVSAVRHLSPEQTHPEQALTPASDIFSLGTILYEMLTLRPLFDADTALDTIQLVRRCEVGTALLPVKESLPGLDKVLHRSLSLNPRHRFQRAFVLREDLRGLMAGFSFSTIIDDTRSFLEPLLRSTGQPPERPTGFPAPVQAPDAPGPVDTFDDLPSTRIDPDPVSTAALAARALAERAARDRRRRKSHRPETWEPEVPPVSSPMPPAKIYLSGAGPAASNGRPVVQEPGPDTSNRTPSPEELQDPSHDTILPPDLPPEPDQETSSPQPSSVAPPTPAGPSAAAGPDLDASQGTSEAPEPPEPEQPSTVTRPAAPETAEAPAATTPPGASDIGPTDQIPLQGNADMQSGTSFQRVEPASSGAQPGPSPTGLPPAQAPRSATAQAIPPLPPSQAPQPFTRSVPPPSAREVLATAATASTAPSTEGFSTDLEEAPAPPSAAASTSGVGGARASSGRSIAVLLVVGVIMVLACSGALLAGYKLFLSPATQMAQTTESIQIPRSEPPEQVANLGDLVAEETLPTGQGPDLEPGSMGADKNKPSMARTLEAPSDGPGDASRGSRDTTTSRNTSRSTGSSSYSAKSSSRSRSHRVTSGGYGATPSPQSDFSQANASIDLDGYQAAAPGSDEPESDTDLDTYSTPAANGSLTATDIMVLEMVQQSEQDFTRSRVLLAMNAKARGDDSALKRYLDQLVSKPENQYNPTVLVELARYYVNKGDYQRALDKAILAERHWARIPPELIFIKKAEIYEIQAAAYQGLFYRSEDNLGLLDKALRHWQKYRNHVKTKSRSDLLARADTEIEKLEKIKARLR